jgi:holo-[acyl-carrier protein] synthase
MDQMTTIVRGGARVIIGTGIDLCEIHRIRQAAEATHGERLIARVYTTAEIAYARRKSQPWERFAARFAAKEAGMKALGTGWRGGIGWHDLEVANLPSGKPTLILHGKALERADALGVAHISLSLTHTAEQAMAMVILESAEPSARP